ncbi:MAG: NUDIX hydrolase [Clostridia bacterium]|nr:NUDIX hydrolase [Clostridia bacterium]
MKEINILGANRFETHSKIRVGCRAVVIDNGKLLVTYEKVGDSWILPGGGLKDNETLEECCAREIEEETGYLVKPTNKFLVINEFYEEYKYVSHYFVCEVVGKSQMKLTNPEQLRCLKSQWIDIEQFIKIVSEHQKYADVSEEKRGSYMREYTAIKYYTDNSKIQ